MVAGGVSGMELRTAQRAVQQRLGDLVARAAPQVAGEAGGRHHQHAVVAEVAVEPVGGLAASSRAPPGSCRGSAGRRPAPGWPPPAIASSASRRRPRRARSRAARCRPRPRRRRRGPAGRAGGPAPRISGSRSTTSNLWTLRSGAPAPSRKRLLRPRRARRRPRRRGRSPTRATPTSRPGTRKPAVRHAAPGQAGHAEPGHHQRGQRSAPARWPAASRPATAARTPRPGTRASARRRAAPRPGRWAWWSPRRSRCSPGTAGCSRPSSSSGTSHHAVAHGDRDAPRGPGR